MAPYRPSGSRSNRSGRNQAEQEVFEGLPVKQWTPQYARQSIVPPVTESEAHGPEDKWSREPLMPRDAHLLQPWTYELLRLARSGKIGRKRKPIELDEDGDQVDSHDVLEGDGSGLGATGGDDRGSEDKSFLAKKWRPVPEHALIPEHRHLEFLAKRRKGLPNLYSAGEIAPNGAVSMRKTRVKRADPVNGEVLLYDVLVPEGQMLDGEITVEQASEAHTSVVSLAPGTVIEGLGVANEDGTLVAEHLKSSAAPRRNRPPPKKKGGPGRGKKRVTFTNPDGTTYTTIVPNATKIIPQPGQTVKHVAKGEEAVADVSAEQAAANATTQPTTDGDGGEEASDDEEGDDEDDDREEGEVSDNDAPETGPATPAERTPTINEVSSRRDESPAKKTEPVTSTTAFQGSSSTPDENPVAPSHSLELGQEREADILGNKNLNRSARVASRSPETALTRTSTSSTHNQRNSLGESTLVPIADTTSKTLAPTARESSIDPDDKSENESFARIVTTATNIRDGEDAQRASDASATLDFVKLTEETPAEGLPKEMELGVNVLAEASPRETAPRESALDETVPDEKLPNEKVTEEEAISGIALKGIMPGEIAQEELVAGVEVPDEKAPGLIAPEESVAGETEEPGGVRDASSFNLKLINNDGDVGMSVEASGYDNANGGRKISTHGEIDDILGSLEADLQGQGKTASDGA